MNKEQLRRMPTTTLEQAVRFRVAVFAHISDLQLQNQQLIEALSKLTDANTYGNETAEIAHNALGVLKAK